MNGSGTAPFHCHRTRWTLGIVPLLMILAGDGVTAQDAWNIDYVGGIPGTQYDAHIAGHFAFAAVRGGLLVLDVAPAQPTQAAFLPLSGVSDIAVEGDHAYLAGGEFRVVDITAPHAPLLVGSCASPGHALVVGGGYAYVLVSWEGIRIIDISEPANPAEIGFFPANGPLCELQLVGDMIYLGEQYYGLKIVDVSNPSSPALVSCYDPDYQIYSVAVHGGFAHLASAPGVRIVDVSNPSEPFEVGVYDTDDSVDHISIDGDYAYLSHWDYITVLDVHSPSSPAIIGEMPVFGRPDGLRFVKNTAYLSAGFGGLRIIDVEDPSAPTEIASFGLLGDVHSVGIENDRIHLTGGFYYSGEGYTGQDELAVTSWWPYAGLFLIDISEPAIPQAIGYCSFGNALDAKVRGSHAYVTDYMGAFGILDLSNPSAPEILGSVWTSYRMVAEAVAGKYAYLVNEESNLRVIDVSDPTHPEEIGNLSVGSNDIEVQGNYAYVTHYYSGLHVVDISDPVSPFEVGTYDPPNWARGLDVDGQFVYLSNGVLGLRVLDVSDPTAPVEVGYLETPGIAENVVVQGRYAYVAAGSAGIRVIDISVPSLPEEIAYFVTRCAATSVAVQDDWIVAGMGRGGVALLRSRLPVSGVDGFESPARIALGQNTPNPCRPETDIPFILPREDLVRLTVLSAQGRRIATLIDGRLSAGPHRFSWAGCDDVGRNVLSGAYYVRLEAGGRSVARRMVLVR